MPSEKMSSNEFDIELVQPIDPEELKIPLQEPFTEAEEPCSKRCKPVAMGYSPYTVLENSHMGYDVTCLKSILDY